MTQAEDSPGNLPPIDAAKEDELEERQIRQLREAKDFAERLIETANVMVVVLDTRGRIEVFNEAAERVTGYKKSEAVGRNWFDFICPAERYPDVQGVFKRWQAGDFSLNQVYENPILTKSGEERYISWRNSRVEKQGVFAGTISFGLDITERKRAERELRLSAQILQNVGALVIVADSTGRVQYVSPSVRDILGYEPEELLGEGWWLMTRDEPAERERERDFVRHLSDRKQTGAAAPYERMVKHRNGEPRWIAWQDAAGPDGAVIGVGHDVTQRRMLEEQLIQSQKMQAVGTLAGGIAHDFNNLLTAINGYSELALSRLEAGDSLRPTIEEIKRAGERAAALTRQLLVFGRKQVLQPQILDLNTVIEGIRGMLRRLMGDDIELITRFAPDLAKTKADPGQIEQVVVNLAVNARDAMPRGGTLSIESANVQIADAMVLELPGMEPGPYVALSISDTGTGMPPEVQSHIFEPFFTTKQVGRGTGLGLSTVYGIIKQSGGHIYCESVAGQGTLFRIYLPSVE